MTRACATRLLAMMMTLQAVMMTPLGRAPGMTVTLGFPLHLSTAPLPSDTRAGHAHRGVRLSTL